MAPADSLRAVLDTVFARPAYDWAERPDPFAWVARWWERLLDWLVRTRATNPAAYQALLWLLGAALVAILLHFLWLTWRTVRGTAAGEARAAGQAAARRDAGALWALAEGLAAEGRYAAALVPAFDALVLDLGERGAVRFHPATTPAEYVRAARLPATERAQLRELVATLYRVTFAGDSFDAEGWRRWRTAARREWDATAH